MALSKLSGDEVGIVFVRLCKPLDPRGAAGSALEQPVPASKPSAAPATSCGRSRKRCCSN
tara:strand:+ start:275 stop:454 length:180 start_codon:yes stop_codon:yes gene_type:complete